MTQHPDATGHGEQPRPLTRAELRAQREAAAAQQAAASASAPPTSTPPTGVPSHPAPDVPGVPTAPPHAMPPFTVPSASPSETSVPGPRRRGTFAQPNDIPPVSPGVAAEPDGPAGPRRPWIEPEDSDWTPSDGSGWLSEKSRTGPVATAEVEDAKPSRMTLIVATIIGLVMVAGGVVIALLFDTARITSVDFDTEQLLLGPEPSLVLTLSESVASIDPEQVTFEPAVAATEVFVNGSTVTMSLAAPLTDSTEYSLSISGVTSPSGSKPTTLQTVFVTPPAHLFLLQRSEEGDDKIFRTDLSGENAVPVFQAPQINDYRATVSNLVIAVENDGLSGIVVTDRDGSNERELPLPGPGHVASVQVDDAGSLVGYLFTDEDISADGGLASVLVSQSLRSGASAPYVIENAGKPVSVGDWRFAPGGTQMVLLDFDGTVRRVDGKSGGVPESLGKARALLGVSEQDGSVILDRDGHVVSMNPDNGAITPLPLASPDYGMPVSVEVFDGGTLRHVYGRDENGMPTGQAIIRVDDEGAAEVLSSVTGTDSIVQVCISPNSQVAAVTVAPDMPNNPFDRRLLPLPTTLHTHLVDTQTGEEQVVLNGFDASWCGVSPRR